MASLKMAEQNDPFPGHCEEFSTLTVHKNCRCEATIDHRSANGQVLNEYREEGVVKLHT